MQRDIQFINLQAQYRAYKKEIDAAIQDVLDSSSYIGGKVMDLERDLETFVEVDHAIGCSSGTDALILAMMALGIGQGDEVVTTPFTFVSTVEAIALLGAKPVFVDIEPETFNIDATKVAEKLTSATKAIMPVSLFGHPADFENLNAIAEQHDLFVIEDGAQSFGAIYNGRRSCSLSHIGTTSFFPAKPLGCYGDGGAVFTDDGEIAAKIRMILNHGQTTRYRYEMIGLNARLDAIQAAILQVKLKHFSNELDTRQKIAKYYDDNLQNVNIPQVKSGVISAWAQYCVTSKKRAEIFQKCEERGVPLAIYYPIPLHLQNAYRYLGYAFGDFPISEATSSDIFALPMSPFLSEEEQLFIIEVINSV